MIERFFGGRDCFFVQVGANDGMLNDPLQKVIKANPQWRGIFIEPQDECFSKLVQNYGWDNRFIFENVAIADTAGERPFYYLSDDAVRETGLPGFSLFASLNRDHLLGILNSLRAHPNYTFKKNLETYISQRSVRCEPLMSVLKRHCVRDIDVFSESIDCLVVQQIDFDRFSPKLVRFDHVALRDQTESARTFLSQKGYRFINCGVDNTMAVRRGKSSVTRRASKESAY